MDDDAVTKLKFAILRDCHASVARLVIKEVVFAEGIGSAESVPARMPVGRVLGILRMIENGHSSLLALQRGGIVHPLCTLAPNLLGGHETIGVQKRSSPILSELIRKAQA